MKIKEMSDVLNGYAFKSSNYINDGYRIIRITNVQSGYIEDEKPVYYEYDNKLEKYDLQENDLLISLTGNVGRCALVTRKFLPAYLNQRVCCLRVNEKIVLPKFLYYILNSKKFEFDCINSSQGIAQLNMSTEWLKKYNLEIPTIELQEKIINIFDKVYNNIDIKKNQINFCNNLIKSQFVEMFGDPVDNTFNFPMASIGSFCFVTKLAGFEYSKYIKYKDSGDVIMVRGLNVKNNKLKLDDVYYIDKDVSDSLPRSQLSVGDICMTYVGINIGDVALVDNKNNYHLAPNVAKISLNDKEKFNPLFFVNLLAYNKRNFATTATNTAKQALNMEKIRNLRVMIPPIELQNKFAMIVEQIDKQKFEFEKSLKKLEELQASLMQEYFG